MPRQVNYNGVVHNFPDGTTDDEISAALNEHEIKTAPQIDLSNIKQQKPLEELKSVASRVPNVLPAIGGTVAGIPGVAAGSVASNILRNISPKLFGDPGSGNEQAMNFASDMTLQGVIPQVAANLMRFGKNAVAELPFAMNLPAVKIAQLINKSKRYMMPESSLLETAGENARDNMGNLSTTVKSTGDYVRDKAGNLVYPLQEVPPATIGNPVFNTPAGKMISQVESEAPAFQKIAPAAKEVMSDIQSVRNAKLATGNPTLIRQIAANDLITRNYSKAADTINPSAILDEIGRRPDVYEEAFGKPALDTFTELMKTAQDKGVGKTTDLLSWREGRKVAYLALPLEAGAALLGVPIGFKTTGSIILGADAIRRVAQSPQLGQMLIQAAKTNAAAPEATLLQKAIVNGLRGTTLYIKRADGPKERFDTSTPQ